MQMHTTPLPADTWLAAAAQESTLSFVTHEQPYDIPATVPYIYQEGGRFHETSAIVFSLDDGNDAFKGAVRDASTPHLRHQRIVTAYAPAREVRVGERFTSWQVNNSEEFLIGDPATSAENVENLPIGNSVERFSDERFRHFLAASTVETLRQANYSPTGQHGEYCLYGQFLLPNEEIIRGGVTSETAQALQLMLNKRFLVRRTGTDDQHETWNIRFIEINPFPQTLGTFWAWYYRLNGAAIDTDILRFVTLDFGGGHLHKGSVDIVYRPDRPRPGISYTAELLGPGTVAMATALRSKIRQEHNVTLELVEARQALITGYAPIKGRRTRIDQEVESIKKDRAHTIYTNITSTLQDLKNYIAFGGGGSVLLQDELHQRVSQKRSAEHFFFAPAHIAPVLNSIGGLAAAYTASQSTYAKMKANYARTSY